jgi:hypothetical protein
MRKNYFKIALSAITLLCSLMSFAQFTVSMNGLYVNNQPVSGSTITFGNNSSSISVNLNADVTATNPPSDSNPGTITIYYKRSSSSSENTPSGGNGGGMLFLGGTFSSRSFVVTLNSGDFNETGGVLYAEYKTYSGIAYKSANYNVVKQPTPAITNNSITGNQTIYAGQSASTINGNTPSGGTGSYTYKWEKNASGSWSVISGATSSSYSPGALFQTTQFRRIVQSGSQSSTSGSVTVTVQNSPPITNNTIGENQTINEGATAAIITGSSPQGGNGSGTYAYSWEKNTTGSWEIIANASSFNFSSHTPFVTTKYRRIVKSGNASASTSNEITINVIPAPALLNNTLSYLNGMIWGSLPTGGTGVYTYGWYLFNADDPYNFVETTKDLYVIDDVFKYLESYPNGVIVRTVRSGRQTITSSPLTLPTSTVIQNNVIKQVNNGYLIDGSKPTGGIGRYTYLWTLFNAEAPYTFPDVGEDLNLSVSDLAYIKNFPNAVIVRSVTSGSKYSNSSAISITQPILNNTITLNGTMITGSTPTGGNGTYQYSWFLRSNEGPYFFTENGSNLSLSSYQWVFTLMANDPTAVIERIVKSGDIILNSNGVRN